MMTRTSLQPLHDPSKSSADGLGRAIGISVAAHLAVVAAFVVRMVVFPSEPMTLENAIRVDIVALPDKSPKLSSVPIVETKIPTPSPPPPDPAPAPAEEAKVPRPKPDSAKIDLN